MDQNSSKPQEGTPNYRAMGTRPLGPITANDAQPQQVVPQQTQPPAQPQPQQPHLPPQPQAQPQVQGQYSPPPSYGQAQPQGGYAPPPGYGQPPQGYYPQQGAAAAPAPAYPPQSAVSGYAPPPQYAPPPGYAPPPQHGYPYPPPPGSGASAAKQGGIPTWGWVVIVGSILAIVLCGGAFAVVSYLGGQVGKAIVQGVDGLGPAIAATGFYSSMETGEYETARSMLSPDLARQYTVQELRGQWLALESQVGTVTMVPPDFEEPTNSDGSITVTLISTSGRTFRITVWTDDSSESLWAITRASPSLIPRP